MSACTPEEAMIVNAARALRSGETCLVGIGAPSAAANLARQTHAPGLVLVYESGAIGAKPTRLPLSIGDGELAATADAVVSVPEMFSYWLQPGRIDVGFLGAAQVDRRSNLNSTVLGDHAHPVVRLPGAGGAPEIASGCRSVIVLIRHSLRTLVERVDFRTTVGFGDVVGDRERWGLRGAGPSQVVTDLGILRPDELGELTLTDVHPGVAVEEVVASTGWDLAVAGDLRTTEPPSELELAVLRQLRATTRGAS